MARGKKQIEGQLCFEFCTNKENYVVQSNDLINSKQSFKYLNSAKLIRAAIMQVKWDDKDFKPYILPIKDFAELLNTKTSNLYRDIENITDDIMKHPVYIRELEKGETVRFAKMLVY